MLVLLRRLLPASVLLLAACTASSPQPQPPSASAGDVAAGSANGAAASSSGASGAAAAASGSAAVDMPGGPADKPAAAQDTPPGSTITNEPPGNGRVTANAGVVPAGSDRMQPMMDLIKANRDGFRKCFDLWGKKNPGQAGKIAFQFFLKVDGSLEKAAIKADEGDVHAAEVESCMITFAKTLTYPKSTIGKETIYTHRFEFKAAPK